MLPARVVPSWLTPPLADPLSADIVRRARDWIGECEEPPSSNRGPMVDAWNRARGAPLGSYWCASFATSVWADCGAETAGVGVDPSCESLRQWCIRTGRYAATPSLGALIFYRTKPSEAVSHHVGLVARVTPYLVTIEGNASWGGDFTGNGECVITRRPSPSSPSIMGYGALHRAVGAS